jgi:hypothetical protein
LGGAFPALASCFLNIQTPATPELLQLLQLLLVQ